MKNLFIETFNGVTINSFIWKGRACWVGIEVAKILGYIKFSSTIGNCIATENFKEGKEYEILEGDELKEFKNLVSDILDSSIRYAPKITIFFEEGLYGFLAYTEKPLGVTFRTWIREEVVPQIRATGAYVLDDVYYEKTYNSDIEFTCSNDYSEGERVKENKNVNSEFRVKNNKLSIIDGKYIEVDKLNSNSSKSDFDIDKFQRLRVVSDTAKLLKGLLDDVDTDSICKLAVIKTLFSEAGIELPIYFNKQE